MVGAIRLRVIVGAVDGSMVIIALGGVGQFWTVLHVDGWLHVVGLLQVLESAGVSLRVEVVTRVGV